ncbi:MAG: helix-turn-helix transcriptional regulator [Alphaproteobacteria bacterium]
MPTIEQIRAARALLDWSQGDLAEYAGLSQTGIARIENGTNRPNTSTLEKISAAFENADIEFIGDSGLRKRSGEIKTFKGSEGFRTFMDDVYETIKTVGGEICVYNVDENNWIKWMGKQDYENHAARMKEIETPYKFKIIVEEGDKFFIANSFAEYKWFPKELFQKHSFYAYGDKLGLINFREDSVDVLLLKQKNFNDSFRVLFNIAWDFVAKKPQG